MIKQITNNEGTFLLFGEADYYSYNNQLIETIENTDIINIEQLKNFPKSLLHGHVIKKQINNKNYTTKIIDKLPASCNYNWYNIKTQETKANISYQSITDGWVRQLKISDEPNIKCVSPEAFYKYFNSYNSEIDENDLYELLKGFNGTKEDIDFVMKQLCYYNIDNHKSKIFIEYIKNKKEYVIFSDENIYTKYIRDYINAGTYDVDRTRYDLNGIYRIFNLTKESNIELMRKHYIPFLLKEIQNDIFYTKYIKTLQLTEHVSPNIIINNNKYLKSFINQINYDFNDKYQCYLKQSNLFISFTS